jgi:hypothetical protein
MPTLLIKPASAATAPTVRLGAGLSLGRHPQSYCHLPRDSQSFAESGERQVLARTRSSWAGRGWPLSDSADIRYTGGDRVYLTHCGPWLPCRESCVDWQNILLLIESRSYLKP